MDSFDWNKAVSTGAGLLSSYWDRQLFKDNPAAAAAYYASIADANQPNTGTAGATQGSGGGWSNPADKPSQMTTGTVVLIASGVAVAALVLTKK